MTYYRTGWISDLHLGTRGSKATDLLNFLRETEFETLYLVGDVIDIWALRRAIYWPQEHNDVIQKLLRKGRKGTEIIYIVGNHDEFLERSTPSKSGIGSKRTTRPGMFSVRNSSCPFSPRRFYGTTRLCATPRNYWQAIRTR